MLDPIRRLQNSATLALILSPVGILLIAAARLLIIADYSPVTASAIVASEGYINTLLGTVIPVVPILMPYLALALLFFRRFLLGILACLVTALISPAAVSSAKAFLIANRDFDLMSAWPLRHIWVLSLVAIFVVLLFWLTVAGFGFRGLVRTLGTIASLAAVVYVIRLYPLPVNNAYYTQLLQRPWLPAEKITFTSRSPLIGYVMSSTNVSMELLTNNDRSVLFIPNGTIRQQEICQISAPAATKPLVTLISVEASIPLCNVSPSASPPAVRCLGEIPSLYPCRLIER